MPTIQKINKKKCWQRNKKEDSRSSNQYSDFGKQYRESRNTLELSHNTTSLL